MKKFLAFAVALFFATAAHAQLPGGPGAQIPNGNNGAAGGGSVSAQQTFNILDYGAVCDGVTNDNTAINAAFAAAAASTAYQNNNKVSITGPSDGTHKGCVMNSVNATAFTLGNGSNTRPQVEIYGMTWLCTGAGNICLDATGSKLLKIHDMSIRGNSTPGSVPEICIQVASNDGVTSTAWHMFERVNCNNTFGFAALYNYGSESDQFIGNMWVNSNITMGPIVRLGAVTGGSSYTNGTYTNVPLTGGSGSGALATIVVSGNAVTSVTVTYEGRRYAPNDTLSAAAASIGGTGSGFSVPVAAAAPFAVVLDGQNHWRVASAFTTVTAPTDAWVSLTLIDVFGDNIRNGQTGTENNASVWMGWGSGVRFVNTYILNSGNGANSACLALFDSGVTKGGVAGPNIGAHLEIDCEGNATYGIIQQGSNATPTWYYPRLRLTVPGTSTAFLGTASNITSMTVQNADWDFWFPQSLPVFANAKLWSVVGQARTASVASWNAPASFVGPLSMSTLAAPHGPLDIFSTNASLAISCARRLKQSYIGALCQFQRASDSATFDAYPNANGDLDINAYTAFCNATTCKLRTAYDQSGNGNNCVQTTAANQPTFTPQFANLGNRAAFTFGDASALALSCAAAATINNLWASGGYVNAVVNQPSNASVASRIAGKTSWQWVINGGGSGNRLLNIFSTSGGDWTAATVQLGSKVIDALYSSANVANVPQFSINGTNSTNTSSTQPVGTYVDDSASNLIIGNTAVTGGTTGYSGTIAEMILYKSQPTTQQLSNIRHNQGAYYGLGASVNN